MSRRPGVVTAFVRALDPKQGRVKVEYRTIEDELLSTWAPIAAPLGGGKRGQLFMPEVGDECLVAFHDGEFEHPFVVGFLWNGEHQSSETDANNRVIVTPGGHQLRFEDKRGETRVVLRSNGKHELLLEDAALDPRVRLVSGAGREVLLDDRPGSGKLELTSGRHRITLDDAPAATTLKLDCGLGVVSIAMNATPVPSLSIAVAGNRIDVGPAGVTVVAAGAANVNAAAVNVTTPVLTVNSGVATFSGTVVASAVVAGTVAAAIYSPGLGNLL